jgi:hypothetical protein
MIFSKRFEVIVFQKKKKEKKEENKKKYIQRGKWEGVFKSYFSYIRG